jgi:hypothetical protein
MTASCKSFASILAAITLTILLIVLMGSCLKKLNSDQRKWIWKIFGKNIFAALPNSFLLYQVGLKYDYIGKKLDHKALGEGLHFGTAIHLNKS